LDERILGIAFSLNTTLIFIEKHRVQKVWRVRQVMETLIKPVSFISANAVNHCEFVALLAEVENEYSEM
jgi:hypothetical protein